MIDDSLQKDDTSHSSIQDEDFDGALRRVYSVLAIDKLTKVETILFIRSGQRSFFFFQDK